MAIADNQQKRFSEKRFDGNPVFLHRYGNDCQVEISLDDTSRQIAAEILNRIDQKIGVCLAQLRDEGGDEVGHDRLHCPNRNPAAKAWVIAELLGRVFHLEKDSASAFEKCRSCFGENGFAAEPVEQFVANFALKLGNLLA
jgi:hypothetical protein